jgi:hypothetical protein
MAIRKGAGSPPAAGGTARVQQEPHIPVDHHDDDNDDVDHDDDNHDDVRH